MASLSAPPSSSNPTLKGHKLLFITPVPIPPEALGPLSKLFPDLEVVVHIRDWRSDGVDANAEPAPEDIWDGVTILFTGGLLPTKEQAPGLQYVQLFTAGAGYAVNDPLFQDKDVVFCAANGTHGPQISEWVVMTYLAFEHHFPKYLEQQRDAKWEQIPGFINDCVKRRVGILGYGAIGRQLARVCRAMGMDVHAYTHHPRPTPESRRDTTYAPEGMGDPDGVLPSRWFSGSSAADLHAFLDSGLDLLVVAAPLTDKTRGLIGAAELAILGKRRTFVSNIARGPIVDTDALVEALDKGVIRGAALDVTDPEPLPEGHRLWGARNVIVTPHVSGNTSSYVSRVFEILIRNLRLLSAGEELANQVSRTDGY